MSRSPFDEESGARGDADTSGRSATDDSIPGPSASGATDDLSKLRHERDELFERLARVSAEFKNAQKRLQLEKDQAVQYANAALIKSLVPVIDNFERALGVDQNKADAATILKGMQMVHDEWLKVLAAQNVELIRPEVGTPFDPNRHEAVMQQPSDRYSEPTVTQMFQNGYALHGRTLRPAKVAVSRTS